ncbi:hypothetical protein COHA_003506 [Chlorella ohadii]|uniref:YbaK/aminoacyl-tRNA synthetase-associated domain-containing protein n=1 Tax=Chlorella ohadii TaxID=2649997 RepID=A0AAD5DS80_9CHLO|nr:hypothetical protein COHA_003506 [Chlorella ohadii]
MAALAALTSRLNTVLARLSQLELEVGVTPADAVAARQLAVLDRIARLEAACGLAAAATAPALPLAAASPAPLPLSAGAALLPEVKEVDRSGSEVQQRLQAELLELGLTRHKFVRAPPEYYDRPLEFRQGIVGAASIHHLCKSIVIENTRAHPSVTDCSDPHNSKYYLVVVQYTARFSAEKMKKHIHRLGGSKFGIKWYNMRLAPEAVSDELTGFEHNGVSPIALKTRLPIIMSHKIAELRPDVFFLGAGEVDLKVGFSAADFVAAYKPMVMDITYDEGDESASETSSMAG